MNRERLTFNERVRQVSVHKFIHLSSLITCKGALSWLWRDKWPPEWQREGREGCSKSKVTYTYK